MKKLLLLILIGLLVALSIFIVINGVKLGSVEILGVKDIQTRSNQLDEKIQEAGKLSNKDFAQAVNNVKDNAKKLEQEKKTYEDMTILNENGETQIVNRIAEYELEKLWITLGNHAKKEGVVIKITPEKDSTSAKKSYNLQFRVNGSYVGIQDFISDVENDSSLGFKIEEFKMQPSSANGGLEATFVCRAIFINGISAVSQSAPETNNQTTNPTNNETSNNATNQTNATGQTNNTNATNTNVAR